MAKITNLQLVEAFRKYKDAKWGYVYGSQGQIYTPELALKWQNAGRSVPDGRDKKTYFTKDCAKWYGHNVADCSGGIVYSIQQYDPGFTDRNANTFKSQFTQSGAISTIPEIPGLALWKNKHIGVYAGNGKGLEFRGTDYGCVETLVKSRPWTHWGKINGVYYPQAEPIKPPAPTLRNLKLETPYMRGEDIKAVQVALNTKGYPCGTADGVFGAKTDIAVKAFQTANKLTPDGIVGEKTRKALGL